MDSRLHLHANDGFTFPAYIAEPPGAAKGAVVLLQEIFGVNAHIRSVADSYAAEGYLVVAPAMFERIQRGVELGYEPAEQQAGSGLKSALEALPAPGVMQDVQAAIAHAASASSGKVAVIGYCWGGLLAWRAACMLDGLAAAVPYYGGGMTGPEESARQPKVPVLAHFGSQDSHIPLEGIEAFKKAQPDVEVHLYEAGHGFNCDARGSFNADAAKLARQRTLAFLEKHLT